MPGKTEPLVELPGTNTFVPLSQADNLPPGTIINLPAGSAIAFTDPSGNVMDFFAPPGDVPSEFEYEGVVNGAVQLVLVGGNFSSSSRHVSSVHADGKKKPKKPKKPKPKKPVRRLWGDGHGRFDVKGKYASADVRGTYWLIADYIDHTLVTVRRGVVAVKNFATNKTTLVSAGHSIIVYAKSHTKPKPKPKKH